MLICSAPAGAQTINVTGYLDAQEQGPLVLVGDRGFAFASGVSINSATAVASCNGDPAHCVPGATLDLSLAANPYGTATLNGTTYYDTGGAASPNAIGVRFAGSVVLPPIAPTATVMSSFTFRGTFTHAVAGSSATAQETLAGGGYVTVYLHSPNTPGVSG